MQMWLEITHLAAWMMIVVAVKNCLQDAVHRLNHVMVKSNSDYFNFHYSKFICRMTASFARLFQRTFFTRGLNSKKPKDGRTMRSGRHVNKSHSSHVMPDFVIFSTSTDQGTNQLRLMFLAVQNPILLFKKIYNQEASCVETCSPTHTYRHHHRAYKLSNQLWVSR